MVVTPVQKLRLAHGCPNCGRQPAFRLFPWERERYSEEDPQLPISTHYCRSCKVFWTARAWHYQEAAPDP